MVKDEKLSGEFEPALPPTGAVEPLRKQMLAHLRRAQQVAVRAVESGHHPFGCILVAPDNETVLLEQGNLDTLNHAETVLARRACTEYSRGYLWNCTLYTSVEPCCMCSGAMYFANIGQLAYGISEAQLLAVTGGNEENPTLNIPCRYVFEHGQKDVKVWGPFPELDAEILSTHLAFWQ